MFRSSQLGVVLNFMRGRRMSLHGSPLRARFDGVDTNVAHIVLDWGDLAAWFPLVDEFLWVLLRVRDQACWV